MNEKPKKLNRKKLVALVLAFLVFLFGFLYVSYQDVRLVGYVVESEKVLSRVRLILITDLHSIYYGEKQEELLQMIAGTGPDCVVLSGDIIDDKRKEDGARDFLAGVGANYPTFYVTGNHEVWTKNLPAITTMVDSYGVRVLQGDTVTLALGGTEISIGGIDDHAIVDSLDTDAPWRNQLNACAADRVRNGFSILLSHRPDLASEYANLGFDLVLCGHEHGGQIRIPGILNGLVAPNEGLFPKYAGGNYQISDTTSMIVSRGLCKDWMPRPFNPPEVVLIDIV